jgi:hypothetical protein
MVNKGYIKDIREDGTAIILAPIDTTRFIHQGIKECYVDYIDSRPLSDKQRKMCYALINAIAEWSGSSPQDIKEAFKLEFWADKVDTLADKIFSLSNAPMSLVAEFQKFLIVFVLENDVPTKFPLIDYVDDIDHYVYMCLIHKKCAICGKKAELHHIDTIGLGNDRTQINHIGKEAISLCREHHKEFHDIGKASFFEKYHLNGGVKIDKTICKIYGLKGK